jgi:uncharacterized protein
MAANLTPDYQKAEQRYRDAQTPAEKLSALEEMLRTIPKHKASEKMQAELKRKLSQLKESQASAKKSGGKDPFHIPKQGGGQVLLLGAPNVGKSAIVEKLTDAPVKVADFPFTTHAPLPGMAYHEDAPIQLVDLPPMTREHVPTGLFGAIYNADLLAVVCNVGADSVLEDIDTVLGLLSEHKVRLISSPVSAGSEEGVQLKRGLVVANGCDLPNATENLGALRDLIDSQVQILPVSAKTGENLDVLTKTMFTLLNVMRVYSKLPGQPADKEAPFVIPAGSTVQDLANHIHKDVASGLKFARVWGEGVFPGQQVHHDHVLHDKDIVEIHA